MYANLVSLVLFDAIVTDAKASAQMIPLVEPRVSFKHGLQHLELGDATEGKRLHAFRLDHRPADTILARSAASERGLFEAWREPTCRLDFEPLSALIRLRLR